ncbi:MAG: amidohydrolase [Acidimicrobiaceae bacterium]|nr:amidohydrolase [Acidimicrobiaceae bacterium]MYG98800.1 amidohydrolase [Acidimicrobiaceae bacterium]MYL02839.1 amidohydrolase [Acidimicrobiaceae bacterium]
MLVDAHTHVVSSDQEMYPLSPAALGGSWYLQSPCSAGGLLDEMDTAGVDRAVLVQPLGAYSFDNRYAVASASARPDRLAAACCVDPYGESPTRTLRDWLDRPSVAGVRFFALSEQRSWLSDPATFVLWEQVAASGAHVIVTVYESQFDELALMLGRFGDVSVSLDHCGFCDVSNLEPLLALARFENLSLKVTTNIIDAATAAGSTARRFVGRLAGGFGAERLMWGSDYCQTHDRLYAELVRTGIAAFGDLTGAQQDACLGGNARRVWFGG